MKKKQPNSQPVALSPRKAMRIGLIVTGSIISLLVLQSLALWLPALWAYPFAANATVWPVLQIGMVVCLGLIALVLRWMKLRKIAIAFAVIAVVSVVPTVQMLIGLREYAREHDISLSFMAQTQLFRVPYPPTSTATYAHVGQHNLELSKYTAAQPIGTIVYIHGGSWWGGSRTENGDFFRRLNAHGYTVYSIDYRLARDDYATWRDAPRDVACALNWVAGERQGKLTLMGDSAGGQLALRTAYGLVDGTVTSSCSGSVTTPDKVVAIVPPIDFYELYTDPKRSLESRKNIARYLGGTPQEVPEAYRDASISSHVQSGLMPTLIINAERDTLVSARSGEQLAERLRSAGNDVEQYTIPYTNHSYWINPGGYQSQAARALMLWFMEK